MPGRPPPTVLLVLGLWLVLPFLHAGSPAQDAIPFVVAADLAGSHPEDIYLREASDLYDLHPPFRDRSCTFYDGPEQCASQAVAYISSPAALPLVAPLAWLDGDLAVLLVRVAGAVAMAGGFLLVLRRLAPVDERLAVVAALLLTFEVNHQVGLGQTSPFLFLAAAMSLDAARSRRSIALVAALTCVCIALKGFPAVLVVPVVLARRWSLLAAIAAGCAALVAASLVMGGIDLWEDFVDSARAVESASTDNPYNGSLTGVLGDPAGMIAGAALLVGAIVALRPSTTDERWSLAMPLALLVVPQVWGHYLATALVAVVVVIGTRVARPAPWGLLAIAVLVPYAVAAGADQDLPGYQLALLVAGIAVCAWLVRRAPTRRTVAL